MKLFMKDKDGKLVEVTAEAIKNLKVSLYLEDGTVARKGEEVSPDEAITNLTLTLSKLATKVDEVVQTNVVKDQENIKLKEENEKFRKASQNGNLSLAASDSEETEVVKIVGGENWDLLKSFGVTPKGLDIQGRMLVEGYPGKQYKMKEKNRAEVVKYMLLWYAAAYMRDPRAIVRFRSEYGYSKTAVGDSGNTFPIPDIVEAEILAFARELSVVLQYARVEDMISEKQTYPAESSSATVQWGNTTSESDPVVGECQLDAEELSAYAAVKNVTLADSRSDIVSWLLINMSEASGLELDNKGFNGLGTDNPFICSGLLSSACGYSVVMGSHSTSFAQITAALLSSMIAKLDGQKKANARWWMHGEVIHHVRSLKDDNGRPIFYDGAIGTPTPPTIYGYPYTEVIKMPGTDATNTAFMVFGNLRYLLVGKRLDSMALMVDPYGLWTTNRTRYKIYKRWALKMALAKGFVRLLTAAS